MAQDFGYTPPVTSTSNSDTAELAALVQRLQAQVAAAGLAIEPPVILTPEQSARKALDNKGAGLGTEERLQELYRHLDTIAKKVGI